MTAKITAPNWRWGHLKWSGDASLDVMIKGEHSDLLVSYYTAMINRFTPHITMPQSIIFFIAPAFNKEADFKFNFCVFWHLTQTFIRTDGTYS